MKKLIAAMLALLLLLGVSALAEAPARKAEFPDNTYVEMPSDYRDGVTQRGKVVIFVYDAQTPDGVAYKKSALVYLPYGYDPEDKETRYNVMYLMHGSGQNNMEFLKGIGAMSSTSMMLDAMIQKGRIEPMILVTPTFNVPGFDESYGANNFWYELENYLIPAFESQYNTYAMDVTPEGIHASRGHRAMGGFSMGSMCTWIVFTHCLDEIAYYMPVAGGFWGSSSAMGPAMQLAESVAAAGYTKDDFIIYAGCGGPGDIAYHGMNDLIDSMCTLTDTFVFCENFADGNLYYTQCNGGHSRVTVELTMYAGLPTFFDN
ncbi:MAG: hypothetical protein IKK57_09035 [Clostridia bacterium]|nr:hypothetical protein [Clostridia bacterium]